MEPENHFFFEAAALNDVFLVFLLQREILTLPVRAINKGERTTMKTSLNY